MERNRLIPFRRLSSFVLVWGVLAGCSALHDENQGRLDPLPGQVGLASTATSTTPAAPDIRVTHSWTPTAYFTPTPEIVQPTLPPAQTLTPVPEPQVCTPLEGHSLTDLHEILTNPFSPPPPGKDTGHHGADFAYYRRGERTSILGVPVNSVLAGVVAGLALNRIPYGHMVIIETAYEALPPRVIRSLAVPEGRSLYLLYAHLNAAPLAGLEERVECGQALGEVGNTPKGWSSDPHLHLEVRAGPPGSIFKSMDFYDTGATLEEMENYRTWRMSGEFQMLDPMVLLEAGLQE